MRRRTIGQRESHRGLGRQFRNRRLGDRQLGSESLESRQLLAGDLIAHWVADQGLSTTDTGIVTQWNDVVSGRSAAAVGSPALLTGALGGRAAVDLTQLAQHAQRVAGHVQPGLLAIVPLDRHLQDPRTCTAR